MCWGGIIREWCSGQCEIYGAKVCYFWQEWYNYLSDRSGHGSRFSFEDVFLISVVLGKNMHASVRV